MGTISMKELADALGVSTASVSVALRGKSGISEETRSRILAEAKRCGYDMKRLRANESKGVIALLDYTYDRNFGSEKDSHLLYSQFTEAACQAIRQNGYTPLGPLAVDDVSDVLPTDVSGFLCLGGGLYSALTELPFEENVPFVIAGNALSHLPVTTVTHDNIYGIHEAAVHLKSLGHTRIGFVRILPGGIGQERLDAFYLALKDLGLTAAAVVDASPEDASFTGCEADVDILIDRLSARIGPGPLQATAYLCDNDLAAAAFMRILRDLGKKPGEEIAVIGFDDQPFAALLEPPLTSIRTYESELATVCVDQLIYSITHPDTPARHIRIATKLYCRESTLLSASDFGATKRAAPSGVS